MVRQLVQLALIPSAILADAYATAVLGDRECACAPDTSPATPPPGWDDELDEADDVVLMFVDSDGFVYEQGVSGRVYCQ